MQEHLTQEKSIYIQISEMIETDICRGILLEEEKVPSTNELAKLYTINPATAASSAGSRSFPMSTYLLTREYFIRKEVLGCL